MRERRIAEAGVLLTVLIWSANFVVVKASISAIGPLTFTSARYVIATLTLFAIVRWRTGAIRRPEGLTLRLLALGMLGFGCYQLVWSLGLTQITAGDSALIVAASPVFVALLAGAVGMDRLTAPKLAGALIAFAGVAIVITATHKVDLGASLLGDALTLLAAVFWAFYTVLGTRMLRRIDPLQATAWTVFGGTLFLLPLGIIEVLVGPPPVVTAAVVTAAVFSGAFAAGIANVLVFNGIRLVGPTRVSAGQFLVPFGAVILGSLVLSEPVGMAQIAGGAVIVLGVWLTRRASILPRASRGLRARVRGA